MNPERIHLYTRPNSGMSAYTGRELCLRKQVNFLMCTTQKSILTPQYTNKRGYYDRSILHAEQPT